MRSTRLVLITMCVIGVCRLGLAQGVQTGTLRGTVRDQQGLVMVGVTITVTSPSLQGERTVQTGGDGTFSISLLPPGEYAVRYEQPLFAPVPQTISVPLGGSVEQNVTLAADRVVETLYVVPPPLASPAADLNLKQQEVESLATPRDLAGIAQLAPAVTDNAPDEGQVVINGAFGFDNAFLVNGVDVNDNVFGTPQALFIEDAIEETQTLTSGISAEYGRFTGGVVNAVTKSGGNVFSGSVRLNLTNPAWTTETPIERTAAIDRPSDLNQTWEATFGGPVARERLWFFAATRLARSATADALPRTNVANVEHHKNRRGEVKLTGTLVPNHTMQLGYLNNSSTDENVPGLGITIDTWSLISPTTPNWYTVATYRGIGGSTLLAEAQYSERRLGLRDFGGRSTRLIDSPFLTLLGDAQYNAPYFDATDPEARNNRQLTGNVTRFFERAGRHEVKGGYEWFRSQITGGNSQSATNYVFVADYAVDDAGNLLFDSTGHLIPHFEPGSAFLQQWLPQRGATLNIDTNSLFVQDRWAVTSTLTADIGIRFEHASSVAVPTQVRGVRTSTTVPRLGAAYDLRGDGRHIVHATYGWYSGRYVKTQVGANNNVTNPDLLEGVYVGPAGDGRAFSPGFDPANYLTVFGLFPTANVFLDRGLRSPLVRELSLSYGAVLPRARGHVEAAYIHRRTANLIDDFIDASNGVTTIERAGLDVGTFTNVLWKNTGLAHRVYDALQFQARYTATNRWTVNGHYTLQLRNDGNYEGEATSQPGVPSQLGNYPEALGAERHFPSGHLPDFERHRLRVWSVYRVTPGRIGELAVSGLWRVDSGRTYSLLATMPLTSIQLARLAAYPDPPSSQTIYFGERGSQSFNGLGLFDTSLNYAVPVFKSVRPYVKLDVFNLFNNQKAVAFNTTVSPDFDGATDPLGIPTRYVQGPRLGEPDDPRHFPIPYAGLTGGRSLRVAVGFRF